jgi:hypothetical protein
MSPFGHPMPAGLPMKTYVYGRALIYALLDGTAAVDAPHINAALGVWCYCQQSTSIIFGTLTGNELADHILGMLRAASSGMTRREINNALGRHEESQAISLALDALVVAGLAKGEIRGTKGRPEERWFADAN